MPTIYLVDSSTDVTGGLVGARNIALSVADLAEVVLVLPDRAKKAKLNIDAFAKVVYLPVVHLRRSVWSFLAYIPALLYSSWKLLQMMSRDGAVRLQINDLNLMHGAILRLYGYRGRIVSWVRFDPKRFGWLLSRVWLRLLWMSSDEVIAVSKFAHDRLPRRANATVLYDPTPLRPVISTTALERSARNDQGGAFRFIYVGNYIKDKGQDMALEAFAAVAKRWPAAELHLFGSDMGLAKNRAYLARLVARSAHLGLAGRVTFNGPVEDPLAVFAKGDAALNFSISETFSFTCLEASAVGLPVIATRSGGPQEIIEDGKTGFLVSINDTAAMTAAMEHLLTAPASGRAMGQAGATLVKKRFSAEIFRSKIIELFDLQASATTTRRPVRGDLPFAKEGLSDCSAS